MWVQHSLRNSCRKKHRQGLCQDTQALLLLLHVLISCSGFFPKLCAISFWKPNYQHFYWYWRRCRSYSTSLVRFQYICNSRHYLRRCSIRIASLRLTENWRSCHLDSLLGVRDSHNLFNGLSFFYGKQGHLDWTNCCMLFQYCCLCLTFQKNQLVIPNLNS